MVIRNWACNRPDRDGQAHDLRASADPAEIRGIKALRGLGGAAHADGWIVWSPSKREGFMVVHHLPVLPAGQRYRRWVVGGAAWVPRGHFQVDPIGHAALTVRAGLERPERFAITVEAAAIGAVPSGPTVMQAGPSS